MPMAIDFETIATIETTADPDVVKITSSNFNESVSFHLSKFPQQRRRHWSDYPVGVVVKLRQRGVPVHGFHLTLRGDVPLGAGLSSSASVEVATAIAVLSLSGTHLSAQELALLCQSAENEFVGGACGIMDQFVITNGQAGHALLLDCRSLEFELLTIPESASIVICNSMVKHTVADGVYGDRRNEVEAGQAVLVEHCSGIGSLRDANLEDLEAVRHFMSPESYARCRHVITENARVLLARQALLTRDLVGFGRLMFEAHRSFRDDFEASCAEIDTLVEIAGGTVGCLGARITGGGFGGCTVNLVVRENADRFKQELVEAYRKRTGLTAECYLSDAANGALARLR